MDYQRNWKDINMINNLLPGLAYSGLANSANNAINSAHTAGGNYDPASMLSGFAGYGLGGAAGAFGGYGMAKSLGKEYTKKGAVSKLGSVGKIGKGTGTLKALIAANPKMAMLGGGALGALVGSKLMTKAVAGPRDMLEAQQQQYYAQKDAQDQMSNMQQAYGQPVRW